MPAMATTGEYAKCASALRAEHHTGPATVAGAEARASIGHVGGGALVAGADVADGIAVVQRVVQF